MQTTGNSVRWSIAHRLTPGSTVILERAMREAVIVSAVRTPDG